MRLQPSVRVQTQALRGGDEVGAMAEAEAAAATTMAVPGTSAGADAEVEDAAEAEADAVAGAVRLITWMAVIDTTGEVPRVFFRPQIATPHASSASHSFVATSSGNEQ